MKSDDVFHGPTKKSKSTVRIFCINQASYLYSRILPVSLAWWISRGSYLLCSFENLPASCRYFAPFIINLFRTIENALHILRATRKRSRKEQIGVEYRHYHSLIPALKWPSTQNCPFLRWFHVIVDFLPNKYSSAQATEKEMSSVVRCQTMPISEMNCSPEENLVFERKTDFLRSFANPPVQVFKREKNNCLSSTSYLIKREYMWRS